MVLVTRQRTTTSGVLRTSAAEVVCGLRRDGRIRVAVGVDNKAAVGGCTTPCARATTATAAR